MPGSRVNIHLTPRAKAQVPPLAQCCVFGASALIKCPDVG